jgi:hypothetical protein
MVTIQQEMISYTPIAATLVSHTSGRLRLRVDPIHRQAEKMQNISNFLAIQPHITQVQTNINSGSILIYHQGTDESFANVLATLHDIGINFTDIARKNTQAATTVNNAVVELNQIFAQATNNTVDLRFLFPLGLSILAVRQLIIKGSQLDMIPWYVLAWYAFDSFLKFNRHQSPNPTYLQ